MKIFRVISVIAIVFILVVVIPSGSNSEAVISYNYSTSSFGTTPLIKYEVNNSITYLANTVLNNYSDSATVYVNSIWWSGITTDNYGNTFYVDTYGNLYENYSGNSTLRYLGTPYDKYIYYGPIVGVAASNNSRSEGGALVQELSEWGVVFELNVTNGNTIALGWQGWILPYAGLPSTTFSAIYEVKSINYYFEVFNYFATNGTIYYYYPDNGAYNNIVYTLTTSKSPAPIISGCSYVYENNNQNGNNFYIMPFGLLYNGSVYLNNGYSWTYFGSASNGARAINIGPSDNYARANSNHYFYLLVTLLKNSTYVYETGKLHYSSRSATFNTISVPTTKGTNEAIAQPWGYGWYILQTNGTVAHSSSWTNPKSWNYFSLPKSKVNVTYNDILNITDSSYNKYTIYANFAGSLCSGIYNMYYYNLTFLNSTGKNRVQFIFNNGNINNLKQIINVSPTYKVLINITFIVDKAYNATFYFYVVIYPQGYPGIMLTYPLKIVMINHFSYIPI